MKKYLLLATTLVFTVITFLVLIYFEKKVVTQEEYIKAYIVNKDVMAYSDLILEDLKEVSITKINDHKNMYLGTEYQINNTILTRDYKAGEIVYTKDILSKDNILNLAPESSIESVVLPISNIDSILSSIITDNRYINIYITINKEYLPSNIEQYQSQYDKDRNVTIFKYLENIKPIKYCDKDGQECVNTKISSVIINVSNEEAIYLNYIKQIAEFNISVI